MNHLRRIVMFNRVTADGYFAAPDGNLDWVVPDTELDKSAAAAIKQGDTDTFLFGRRTYEMFASFWPHVLDAQPDAPDPHGGRRSPEMRAMAVMLNEATKWVFSRTLDDVAWHNSRLLRTFDPAEIQSMKTQPGKDIMILGSGSIVSLLAEHALIDEYQIVVNPTFLGSGRPLISGVHSRLRLELVEATPFPSGSVRLRYTPAR